MYALSDEYVHKLLDLYKSFECLWNKDHENYKNKDVRKHALKEIQIQMNVPKFTVKDVKRKLSIMKTSYQRDVKHDSGKKPFWFEHADSFLRQHWETNRQDEIYKLLDIYKSFECLWNKKHEKYYDEDVRKLALKEIAIQMNLTIGYVKAKITNMLSAYRKAAKGVLKKQYWFDHADSFLSPYRLTAEHTVIKEEYEMDIEDTVIVKQEVEDYNDDNNETNRNIINTSNENIEARFIKPAPVKNKLDKFGRLMIDYLREMPPKRQLRCQAEIESIMLQFRTENLMNTEDF